MLRLGERESSREDANHVAVAHEADVVWLELYRKQGEHTVLGQLTLRDRGFVHSACDASRRLLETQGTLSQYRANQFWFHCAGWL